MTWPPLDAIPPASWTVVMAAGIVSTDLSSDRVWTWVAFTVSLLALAGLFRRGWPVLRGQHRPRQA
jgi:hypothetical protein